MNEETTKITLDRPNLYEIIGKKEEAISALTLEVLKLREENERLGSMLVKNGWDAGRNTPIQETGKVQ